MEIQEIINIQRKFFNSNKTKDVGFRVTQLKKLKEILKKSEKEIFDSIYKDFGKSEFETYVTELSLIYSEINSFIKNIKFWSRKKHVSTNLANWPARSYIMPEPLGVTLVIGAWNYPFQLSLAPAVSSIAAGNTVVLKPSEVPSRTSSVIAKLINDNFDPQFFKVVEGGVKETTELLNNKFDKIFFTGSTTVGKIVYQAAAKHLTPVTLELGGKSPAFVMEDCNIKITAQRIVWAKFLNAGQTCIAPDYILVQNTIKDKFLLAVKGEIEKHYKDTGELAENYLRIINDRNFDRLMGYMDQSKIYCGGKSNKEERIIRPTVMHNVDFEDTVMKEEIFGPILPVIGFDDFDWAIAKVKERSKPLSCYIYSKSSKSIDKLLKEVSFGGGAVNDSVMHLSNDKLPFGGVGLSGMGNYHGKSGFDSFSHFKSILHRPFLFEPNFKYAPYSSWKKKIISWLLE